MLHPGTRIKIIEAGCGATACNGYTGRVVAEMKGDIEVHGLPEKEPHIKVLLDRGVYWESEKEYWRVNTLENGFTYEVCGGCKEVLANLFSAAKNTVSKGTNMVK